MSEASARPATPPHVAARPAARGVRSASTAPARPGGTKEPARV
ncbi:hypothetical protein ACFUJ0_17470 [Streptomyces sp. NPDC057242]